MGNSEVKICSNCKEVIYFIEGNECCICNKCGNPILNFNNNYN